ncbi:MAG TPA: permease [Actinomycetota bacterium]|nr:permease [Actinomycetota bacterium]
MAVAERVSPPTRWAPAAILVLALALAAVVARSLGGGGAAAAQNFLLVFASLLIEALPFIVLGAAVSALIEVYVPVRAFARLARLPGPVQMPLAGFGGFAFPVCECGSVPVARRLVLKGLSPGAAVTFMLAAPILNPVVLVATAIAYRGRDLLWPMVLGRAGLGLLVALAVGWVVARRRPDQLLRPTRSDEHDHAAPGEGRLAAYFGQLAADFAMLARFLIVGAAAAALIQTFVPQSVVGAVAGTPVLDVVAMMALAAALSLCSESDAFVAASFVQFGFASQLAFLVAGPMIDTKLGALYAGTFGRRFAWTVAAAVFAVTLAGALWFQVAFG